MEKPWDALQREVGESALDFACRKTRAMSDWHHAHSAEENEIHREARIIATQNGDDHRAEARDYVARKMEELYLRHPIVPANVVEAA
jgi:hypothetical protein